MDTAAFAAAVDGAFIGDLAGGVPVDPRFTELVDDIPGFSTAAQLAALNTAAQLLPEGEAYLEVGTFKGRSICGAMLDAPDRRRYVAVENFLEFGMIGRSAAEELSANLARHAGQARLQLLDGDCFRVLADPSVVGAPVGVYFYDGAHTGLAHYLALGVVEPLLADEALVLIDDASWPMVAAATWRFISRHPGWQVLRDIRARTDHDPRWGNGLLVLAYRRPPGRPRAMTADVRWRRLLQAHLRAPATRFVWQALDRYPRLVPIAKRLAPKKSRQVSETA